MVNSAHIVEGENDMFFVLSYTEGAKSTARRVEIMIFSERAKEGEKKCLARRRNIGKGGGMKEGNKKMRR